MKASDIKIGNIYKHKTSSVGYAQVVAVLPPKTGANTKPFTVVKCAWSTDLSFNEFSLCKYFKPSNLTPYESNTFIAIAQPQIKLDGDKWCATGPGFIDLAVSPAGFGNTPNEALAALERDTK